MLAAGGADAAVSLVVFRVVLVRCVAAAGVWADGAVAGVEARRRAVALNAAVLVAGVVAERLVAMSVLR